MKRRPKPPAPMSARALAKWNQLLDDLRDKGTWTDRDRHALYILATSLAQYEHAEENLIDKESGECLSVVLSATGNAQKNPFILVQNQAWDRCQKLLHAFGLTPMGRAALKQSDEQPVNLKDLIGGK